ncbi:MAG: ArdC-like ssDNA-binding domain-containing protein [Oscillospiraceae bacterium]|nr:ArdC-like ssDNA-binding domain-containing protein [Oscillospiraceae bacterium]
MNNFDDILNNQVYEQGDNSQYSKDEYATKKQTEREDLFALSDDAVSKVSNNPDMFRQYLDIQSRLDRYSAVNVLLIQTQKPDATRLGEFDYWKNKGASVKPGEKGISILEPHEYHKDNGAVGTSFNVKKVFDISQVSRQKMKLEPKPPTYTDRQKLSALVHKAPVPIIGVDELAGDAVAQTNPDTGAIQVRKGMEFADTFSSVAHELAAAEVGKFTDTQIDSDFSAYSVSYLLCKKHGVDIGKFDFSDVGAVFENLDAQEMKAEFKVIRDTFADISARMNKQLEQQKASRDNKAR